MALVTKATLAEKSKTAAICAAIFFNSSILISEPAEKPRETP
jgi:hypothetical protein